MHDKVHMKRLTRAQLDRVQAHCERAIETALGNFESGFGRMEDLVEISKVIEMLSKCVACDEPQHHETSVTPMKGKKAA